MARSAASQIVRQVREQARAELVSVVLANEAATVKAWEPTLRRLRRRLATASSSEVDALVSAATRELAGITLQRVQASIVTGARLAASAAERQHQNLTGPGGPMHTPGTDPGPGRIPPLRERALVEAAWNGSFTRDRIPLSTRLYRNATDASVDASAVVRSSIAAREGVFQAAENFIAQNRDSIQVPIPRYTQDLIDAARLSADTGDRTHLLDAIAEHTRQMDALGEGANREDGLHSLRSSVRQFVRDLERAKPEALDRIIQRHIEDRAQIQARRIMRTETVEAHRRAFRASAEESPYTQGFRWTLSPAHPRPDVCDLLANQNLHDLGPGGYSKNDVPETPHPNCIPPGHLIETERGQVPIEQIERGNLVRTHTGSWRRVLRLSARQWSGELVVATVGESRLVATPEHPFLTARGWKTADLLVPGDRLFLRRDAYRSPAERREIPLLDGVGASLPGLSVPLPGVNFDCDQFLDQGEIDVEFADRELRTKVQTESGESISDVGLMLGESSQGLDASGAAHQANERLSVTTKRIVRGGGHFGATFGASSTAGDELLLTHGALHHTSLGESNIDGRSSDAVARSNLQNTQSIDHVEPLDLVDVQADAALGSDVSRCEMSGHFILVEIDDLGREPYTGLVHNFAVDTDESYCVNGIVAHNCLCSLEAIIDEHYFRRQLAARNGTEAPPTPWVDTNRQTADEWLAGQPESFREQLLGPTRAEIFNGSEDGRRAVISPRGVPIPVHQVLGLPPRRRQVALQSLVPPPPPPSPPPPPASPQRNRANGQVSVAQSGHEALLGLRDALKLSGAARARATREANRRLFQTLFPEERSWDLKQNLPDVDALSVRKLAPRPTVPGSHAFGGRLSIDSRWMPRAHAALEAVAASTPVGEAEAAALSTFLHEAAHEHSPISRAAIFTAYGTSTRAHVVEEVTAELYSRIAMSRLGIEPESSIVSPVAFASYQKPISRTIAATREHVPAMRQASDLTIAHHIVASAARLRREAVAPFTESRDYVNAFARALGVPEASIPVFQSRLGIL